jgi:galactonate dehydratase
MLSRRTWLRLASLGAPIASLRRLAATEPVKITGIDSSILPVNARGNWVIVRLRAQGSLAGLGEASHGARAQGDARMRDALEGLSPLVVGRSPFEIEAFRQAAWPRIPRGGLLEATACSAVEAAMWDLAGKSLGVPTSSLLGGRLRERIPVYANVNRSTRERTPEEFGANAAKAAAEGFRAVKAAPFDDFPRLDAPAAERERMADLGIRRVEAIRKAVGASVAVLIDCHSHFDRRLAIDVARRLDPLALYWYEEPVSPRDVETTAAIRNAVKPRLAGGEHLFGVAEFEPLCRRRALDVIMPDVKHCGGLLEAKKIAAVAELHGVDVSPHNPSGPVSTAASAELCATLPNFGILEYAWGEAEWRRDLVEPPETLRNGELVLSDRPGIGITLDEAVLRRHAQ